MKSASHRSPDIATIARAVKLSVPTVSLALNHHPRVAAATRERVQAIAAKLGYRANPSAQRLARQRFSRSSQIIDQVGLIFHNQHGSELHDGYLAMLLGVEHEVSARHAMLSFLRVATDADWEKVARLHRAGMVDGWLLLGNVDDSALKHTAGLRQPLVVLGGHSCRQPVASADVDFAASSRLAVQHLADLGHQRIAFLGGSMRYSYQRALLDGFRAALRERQLDAGDSLILLQRSGENVGHQERLLRALRRPDPPTAVFVAETDYGASTLSVLRQWELNVPRDLSLVTVEIGSPKRTAVGLTSVVWPFAEVGRAAAGRLWELNSQPQRSTGVNLVTPQLVAGWSCAAVSVTADLPKRLKEGVSA